MLTGMKQSSLDLNLSTKKTRKQELLAQMDRVVPWAALVELIAPYYPEGKNGRPPFALEAMLRVHCMQQWFTLSDLAMEEAFFDTPIYREFAGLDAHGRMPDESTILRFGSVALPADERVSGGNGCPLLKQNGFFLPMHKTGRQKTAHCRPPS